MSLVFSRSSSNYITVPYNAAFAFTTAVTIAAWVRPGSVTMQRVVSRYTSASVNTEIWGLDVYQNNCRMLMGKATNTGFLGALQYSVDTAAGGSVPAGVWTHIAGTWDGSTMRVYVNGTQVGSTARTNAMLASNTTMSIGADYRGGTTVDEFFDGSIEDVRLYNRAVSANEIQSMWATHSADRNRTSLEFNLEMHGGGPLGAVIPSGTGFRESSNRSFMATTANAGIRYGELFTRRRKALSGG